MRRYPGQWLVLLGYVAWVGCVLYAALVLVSLWLVDSTSCELAPGSSYYGEATRSWIPPGTTCTWDLGNYPTFVVGPSPLDLAVVVAALVGLPVLLHLSRLLRASARREAQAAAA